MSNYSRLIEDKKINLPDITIVFQSMEKLMCSHDSKTQVVGYAKKKKNNIYYID